VQRKILIIDNDASIRWAIASALRAEGHEVLEADSGEAGIESALREAPDLVLCGATKSNPDGFEVLQRVRHTPALNGTQFVFFGASDEHTNVRRGMNLGADDYLTDPFSLEDLLASVRSRLKRADSARQMAGPRPLAVSGQLRRGVRSVDGQMALLEKFARSGAKYSTVIATVLFTDIRGFTTISERLSAAEMASLLNAYLERACDPIMVAGGKVVKFIGDAMMAVFPHPEGETGERQALAAIRAGFNLSSVASRFGEWIYARYAERELPDFAIGVGIHTGEVTLCQIGVPGQQSFTAIGDTVNIASRLEAQTKELGWPVVASEATIRAAGSAVLHGASRSVKLRGRTKPVMVYEVVGLREAPGGPRSAELAEVLQPLSTPPQTRQH